MVIAACHMATNRAMPIGFLGNEKIRGQILHP